ncbi:MAG: cysteine hydrolase [Campylobacter sp.]|nr:cysteine hydrolase [Campylobacter sp.]
MNLLVVVDMQNDFIDGALGFDGADEIVPLIANKILEYKQNGDAVVFTLDTHTDDYLKSIEGQNLPIKHCIKGTLGHEIHPNLKELAKSCKIFEKPTFGSWELGEFVRGKCFEKIELVGIVSNICVISNAVVLKSASPNSRIIINAKMSASNDKSMQEKAYAVAKNLHIEVL